MNSTAGEDTLPQSDTISLPFQDFKRDCPGIWCLVDLREEIDESLGGSGPSRYFLLSMCNVFLSTEV